jgi:hypothetical protein
MDQEPQRIGNARWTIERFMRHVNHEVDCLNTKFIVPLRSVLAATDMETTGLFLAWYGEAISRGRAQRGA